MEFKSVNIDEIIFDLDNPRITRELSYFSGSSDEMMNMAKEILLGHTSESRGPGADELKKSIIASGGIIEPIILLKQKNDYLCIEGNTRLAIYKSLNEDDPSNSTWKNIISLIHENLELSQMNDLRLQAHFVGKKEWSPYAKGAFINKMLNETAKTLEQIQGIVGGNLGQIKSYMYAYKDFKEYYEDNEELHGEGDYIEKENFSYFVEAKKRDITLALESNNFTMKNFAKWVKDKKLIGAATYTRRLLADVLNNDAARAVFLQRGKTLKHAEVLLPRASGPETLENSTIEDLCDLLNEKLNSLSSDEKQKLKMKESLTIPSLYLLSNELLKFIEEIENL